MRMSSIMLFVFASLNANTQFLLKPGDNQWSNLCQG